MSKELEQIKNDKLGYRNENISNDIRGDYNLKEIINFEIDELQNTDILETLNVDSKKEAISIIEENFNENIEKLFGLWLATKENTEKVYRFDEYDILTKYALPEDFLVISDLGPDGILIASKSSKSDLFEDEDIDA